MTDDRKTLGQFSDEANGRTSGAVCPKCGAGHLGKAEGVTTGPGGTAIGYRDCRSCGGRFKCRHPPRPPYEIIEEVKQRGKDFASEDVALKVLRESA